MPQINLSVFKFATPGILSERKEESTHIDIQYRPTLGTKLKLLVEDCLSTGKSELDGHTTAVHTISLGQKILSTQINRQDMIL